MRRVVVTVALVLLAGPGAGGATAVAFDCSGRSGIAAMENSYVDVQGQGPCWGHLGHHTYDTGRVHEVSAVAGRVFTVEVQLSPPLELVVPDAAAIVFEASEDGRAWTTLHQIPYPLLMRPGELLPSRQGIDFAFDAGGARARWLRIRQPLSSGQGLSGYLDSSRFSADLTVAASQPSQTTATQLRCADDILERFWLGHPCWFGGVNRYDSPSFFHTYPIAPTTLTGVSGSVTFLPWRSDDYWFDGASRRDIAGFVQVSDDGVTWNDVMTLAGLYGVPIDFDTSFSPRAARYVRLVAEHHYGYARHPALKHARGFILDSSITITAA